MGEKSPIALCSYIMRRMNYRNFYNYLLKKSKEHLDLQKKLNNDEKKLYKQRGETPSEKLLKKEILRIGKRVKHLGAGIVVGFNAKQFKLVPLSHRGKKALKNYKKTP